jgi:hypothetical protein
MTRAAPIDLKPILGFKLCEEDYKDLIEFINHKPTESRERKRELLTELGVVLKETVKVKLTGYRLLKSADEAARALVPADEVPEDDEAAEKNQVANRNGNGHQHKDGDPGGDFHRKKVSPEQAQRILFLLDQGVSVEQIAMRTSVGGTTIRRIRAIRATAEHVQIPVQGHGTGGWGE